jgi:sulfopyruvate decarboxylase TPP-binding subunit
MTPELAERVVSGLKSAGVDFLSFLPESRIGDIIPLIEKDDSFTMVRASHEGTAVSMAAGAALAGKQPAVYMEGTGLILSLYNLQGTAIRCGLPLLLLVSHVGSPGDRANSMTFSGYGMRVEGLLRAMGLPFEVVYDGDRIETRIGDMVRAAQSAKLPGCLLFTGEFTTFTGGWT